MSVEGDLVQGQYDTLPRGFGLGLASDRVDVAGIERLIARTADLRVSIVVDEPIDNFGEWAAAHLLLPFGFFLRASLGNLLSVGSMEAPTPDQRSGAVTIAPGDVLAIGDWSSDVQSVVGTVVWRDDQQAGPDGEYALRGELRAVLSDEAGRLVPLEWPKARTVEVASPGTRTAEVAARFWQQVAARFSTPPATVTVSVDFRHVMREVGEFVSLTLPLLPSRFSAARGVSGQLWEVVGKRVDLARMQVDLTLRQSATNALRTRFLSPAMRVASVAVNAITVEASDFSPATQDDVNAFAVGDLIVSYPDPKDWYARGAVMEITDITGYVVTVNAADSVGTGAVLLMADIDASDPLVNGGDSMRYAHRATTSEQLRINSGDPALGAHVMS